MPSAQSDQPARSGPSNLQRRSCIASAGGWEAAKAQFTNPNAMMNMRAFLNASSWLKITFYNMDRRPPACIIHGGRLVRHNQRLIQAARAAALSGVRQDSAAGLNLFSF